MTESPTQDDSAKSSMESVSQQPDPDKDKQDLTLSEAAAAFTVSIATLRRLVAAEMIAAYKVSGVRGREWRIAPSTLEQAGYARTTTDLTASHREVQRLSEALSAERAKTSKIDSQLGHVSLALARLGGRLREAGINPDDLYGADIDVDQHRATDRL